MQKNNKITTEVDSETSKVEEHKIKRRDVLKNILGVGVGACVATCGALAVAKEDDSSELSKADDPSFLLPQEGDCLVNAEGPDIGKPIDISKLEVNKKYIVGWPMDPESGVIRDGSRFNKVLAIKLEEEDMNARTKKLSDNGILVFSGVCTHQGCDISAWVEDKKRFFCFCHYSQFDPLKFGKVAYGPARKKLPILPIKVEGTTIKVAGAFSKKPGGKKK